MTPCEVEATFTADGQARPRQIVWDNTALNIVETGRRWQDGAGQHILARVQDGRVFELLYNGANWFATLINNPPHFA